MVVPIVRQFQEFGGVRYFKTSEGYYAASRYYDNRLMHRDVWHAANGPIPRTHTIHHRDGDKANNRLDNLQLVTHREHYHLHGHRGWAAQSPAKTAAVMRESWQHRKSRQVACAWCGVMFLSTGQRTKFCCQAHGHRYRGD
jgi:hypothetical protein